MRLYAIEFSLEFQQGTPWKFFGIFLLSSSGSEDSCDGHVLLLMKRLDGLCGDYDERFLSPRVQINLKV